MIFYLFPFSSFTTLSLSLSLQCAHCLHRHRHCHCHRSQVTSPSTALSSASPVMPCLPCSLLLNPLFSGLLFLHFCWYVHCYCFLLLLLLLLQGCFHCSSTCRLPKLHPFPFAYLPFYLCFNPSLLRILHLCP